MFRGQFAGFTDPAALDMSVLGRDILNIFALVVAHVVLAVDLLASKASPAPLKLAAAAIRVLLSDRIAMRKRQYSQPWRVRSATSHAPANGRAYSVPSRLRMLHGCSAKRSLRQSAISRRRCWDRLAKPRCLIRQK